ncbi:MAG: peptide deformylase [Simkaniaceae bacterium]|nr:peptide deformylase [Simkaniaceae bacterium]
MFSHLLGMLLMSSIVTIDCPQQEILKKRTEPIKEGEQMLAEEIASKLYEELLPRMPAAGLAAPQIGISRSMFLFSYDRQIENLEVVINPSFTPNDETQFAGWEACFSVLLSKNTWKVAKVSRYQNIRVRYQNLSGKTIEKDLTGFGATVFQHEYDHLQGLNCVDRPNAEIKSFDTKEELIAFMKDVKKEDAKRYEK